MERTLTKRKPIDSEEDVGVVTPPARVSLPVLEAPSVPPGSGESFASLDVLAKKLGQLQPTKPDPAPRPQPVRYRAVAPLPVSRPVVHSRPRKGFE